MTPCARAGARGSLEQHSRAPVAVSSVVWSGTSEAIRSPSTSSTGFGSRAKGCLSVMAKTIIQCDASGCRRGIRHKPGSWSDPCSTCKGLGGFTVNAIAKMTRSDRRTIYRLIDGKNVKSKTAARIFLALAGKLGWL